MEKRLARKSLQIRRTSRGWFACAFALALWNPSADARAQDGIRELRNPSEMAQVAPVRAIGIRLTPAVPLSPLDANAPSAPAKVSLRSGSGAVTATLSGDVATSAPVPSTIQAQAVSVAVNRPPEKIVPKSWTVSKASVVASESLELPALEGTNQPEPIRVTPQAPIRLTFSNEQIHTAEGPSAASQHPPSPPLPLPASFAASTNQPPAVAPAESIAVEPVEDVIPPTPAPRMPLELTLPSPTPLPPALPSPPPIELPPTAPPAAVPTAAVPIAARSNVATPTPVAPVPMSLAPAVPPLLDMVPTSETVEAPAHVSERLETTEPEAIESTMRADEPLAPTATASVHDAPPAPSRAMQLAPPTAAPSRTYSEHELAQALAVEMESQTAREIQVDVAIQGITVTDESVCRALASDGRVFLVGGQLGEAVVEVKPVDGSPSRLLKVKVIAPWQSSHGVADLDQLLHAIRPLSPNGNLTIRAQSDGSLLVQGKVDNKETARRVMELTRKLILVPVVDKLEIR